MLNCWENSREMSMGFCIEIIGRVLRRLNCVRAVTCHDHVQPPLGLRENVATPITTTQIWGQRAIN